MKSFKIVTGERGEGKTTYILSHFSNYKGYVTVHRNDEYFLKDLETKEELFFSLVIQFSIKLGKGGI